MAARWITISSDARQALAAAERSDGPNIFKMLDLSTAHLPQHLRESLNASPGVIAHERAYGWLMWVPEDPDERAVEQQEGGEHVDEAVLTIWRYACRLDCAYVLFDSDASIDPNLPTY
jgi:hypothetical protein